jgi:hypothetical protein
MIDTDDPEKLPCYPGFGIVDPAGTFYRFGLAHSIIKQA